MLINIYPRTEGEAYIAGSGDGIVTAQSQPSSRKISLLDTGLNLLQTTVSLPNGHYMFTGLDPNKEYMVIARDYKKQFEPCAWDRVKPATDLTHQEQMTLWQSWQTI